MKTPECSRDFVTGSSGLVRGSRVRLKADAPYSVKDYTTWPAIAPYGVKRFTDAGRAVYIFDVRGDAEGERGRFIETSDDPDDTCTVGTDRAMYWCRKSWLEPA